MTYGEPTRANRRGPNRRTGVLGLLIVVASACGCQLPAPSTPSTPGITLPGGGRPAAAPGRPAGALPRHLSGGRSSGALGEADGAVPDGTTVFDDSVAGVANLDPALLDALRRAAHEASSEGVVFTVDSGWRSPAYQERLLQQAIARYGSRTEAARWVASPTTSAHVTGHAVDLGSAAATGWLSEHGAAYGLCRIYDNEPWHYELRPEARDAGCPARYADAAHDPRLQH